MKTSSDTLFQLIKAMTKGEKSNFKKSATQTSLSTKSSNYVKLFDAISKMSEYDEAVLLKKFKNEAFTKNFVATKQYLKAQILKSLRNYSVNKSITFKLREELLDIEILIEKGIFTLARTKIKKALVIAEKYELIHTIFELQKMESEIVIKMQDFKSLERFINKVVPAQEILLKQQKHIQYYWHIHIEGLFFSKKRGYMLHKEFEKKLDEYPLDSFWATHYYLLNEMNISRFSNNAKVVNRFAKAHYELFQKRPEQIEFNPLAYYSSIINYSYTLIQLQQIDEGRIIVKESISILEKAVQQRKINKKTFARYNLMSRHLQLGFYVQLDSRTLFQEHYLRYKELLARDEKLIVASSQLTSLCTVLMCEVILEEWKRAEETYQLFNEHKKRGHRNDLEAIVRLIGLIIYYETNNLILLDISIDAAYQFVRPKEFLGEFPRHFLNFFKYKMIGALNKEEQVAALHQFKIEMVAFFEEKPKEAKILGYFDFIAWIDSKVNGVSLFDANCLREKKG